MLQRVLIGLAVLPRPALLVADEPTSALDVTIQKRILDLLSRLQHDLDISLLLITHDLAIAAERANSLVVLKDGVIQEAGRTAAVFSSPASAYARKLHADVPALNPDRYAGLRDPGFRRLKADAGEAPKIEVSAVTKTFTVDGKALTAVDDVSFIVPAGTTHALVGESGSGKTTAIRLLLGLEEPDSGSISVAGEQLTGRSPESLRAVWRHLQLVYQNPFTSLDPTWKVEQLVREPLDRFKIGTSRERAELVREALADVGLGEHLLSRRPGALVRWPAPARGHRPVAGPQAGRDRARRAHLRARRQRPGRHRRSAALAAGQPGPDLCVRLPRPGPGAPARPHRLGDAPRAHRRTGDRHATSSTTPGSPIPGRCWRRSRQVSPVSTLCRTRVPASPQFERRRRLDVRGVCVGLEDSAIGEGSRQGDRGRRLP